ncbi:MAG: hypothetical protein K2O57_03130, partial [Acetatifactor sp.]|nr:hypothetical protein [Acetatifactor sp.]
ARAAVTEALNPLLSGIMRVFDYFNSHFNGTEIENVSIVGLGAQFIGVPEILGEALGIVCRKAGMFQDVEVYDSDIKQKSDAYSSCIGAGFAGDGFIHETEKAKISKETNYTGASVLIGLLCAVAAIAMAVMAILPYREAKAEEKRLQNLLTTYEQGKVEYDKFVATENLYTQITIGTYMSKHPNDNLLVFMEELEKKLPFDVSIEEFTSDDEQCIMQIDVADKSTAAKVLDTLRDFDSVMLVTMEVLSEEQKAPRDDEETTTPDDPDQPEELTVTDTYVSFVVHCIYYPAILDIDAGTVK